MDGIMVSAPASRSEGPEFESHRFHRWDFSAMGTFGNDVGAYAASQTAPLVGRVAPPVIPSRKWDTTCMVPQG